MRLQAKEAVRIGEDGRVVGLEMLPDSFMAGHQEMCSKNVHRSSMGLLLPMPA